MNLFQRVLQAVSRLFGAESDPELNDLGGKPVFANAVKDIKSDINKINKAVAAHEAAAEADKRQAERDLANAKDLENSAQGLEQPVSQSSNNQNQKNNLSSRIIVGGILGVVIIAIAIFFIKPMILPAATPRALPATELSGPNEGSLMAFGDGSVLVFLPDPKGSDNNGQHGFWITLNPISNYQFSLCVQAGKCKPPTDPNALKDYLDPSKADSPVGIVGPDIVGPDRSAGYCSWLGGTADHRNTDSGIYSNTGSGTEGIHCVFDHPLPLPQFLMSSPYYDPGLPMEDMTPKVLKTEQFCQTNQGFQTFDLQLDSDQSISSVKGNVNTTCQVVNRNRVVCFGNPNTTLSARIAFNCDGAHNLRCPVGSEFNGASCSNNMHGGAIAGMDDWEMDSHGFLVPTSGAQLPSGGFLGPITHNMVLINGVMVVESLSNNALSLNSLSINELSVNGLSRNAISNNGNSGNEAPTNVASGDGQPSNSGGSCGAGTDNPCPFGYTCDPSTSTCVAPQDTTCNPGNPNSCPSGEFCNSSLQCQSICPGGCSAGTVCNPSTQTCDQVGCANGQYWNPNANACQPLLLTCPTGYYFDAGATACVSLGAPRTSCLDGYHFDSNTFTCEADQPNGNYPGCPKGQLLNPLTGICDTNSQMLSLTSVMMYETLQVSLPECLVTGKGNDKGGNSVAPVPPCDPKYSKTCP